MGEGFAFGRRFGGWVSDGSCLEAVLSGDRRWDMELMVSGSVWMVRVLV